MSEVKIAAVGVAVPWVVGSEVGATPGIAPDPAGEQRARIARKLALIAEDVTRVDDLMVAVAATHEKSATRVADGVRESLERASAFQKRRQEWMTRAATATPEDLQKRQARLEAQLGPEEVMYLQTGLPLAYAQDQRLLDLLGELALVRLALGAPTPEPVPAPITPITPEPLPIEPAVLKEPR